MAVYRLPSREGGERQVDAGSLDEARSRAQAEGWWQPGMGTFGANSLVSGGGDGGGGGGGGNGGLDPLEDFFQNTSGFAIKDLEERKRQFDQQLDFERQRLERLGLPELAIQQQLANLQEQEFQFERAMALSNQGLDLLKFGATLRGPEDYFQSSDFMRGARERADVPLFLQQLQGNTGIQVMPGPGGEAPVPLTIQSLGGEATGTGGGPPAPVGAPAPAAAPTYNENAARQFYNQAAILQGANLTDEQIRRFTSNPAEDARSRVRQMVQASGDPSFDAALRQYGPPQPGESFDQYYNRVANRAGPSGFDMTRQARIQALYHGLQAAPAPASALAPAPAPAAPAPVLTAPTPTARRDRNTDAALATIDRLFRSGANKLGPQSLEALSSDELALLQSGGDYLGYSVPAFLEGYNRSRIGQRAAQPS